METQKDLYKQMRLALIEALGNKCRVCGSTINLILHHKDKNRTNNAFNNFEVLCKSCHGKEHSEEFKRGMARINALKKQGHKKFV